MKTTTFFITFMHPPCHTYFLHTSPTIVTHKKLSVMGVIERFLLVVFCGLTVVIHCSSPPLSGILKENPMSLSRSINAMGLEGVPSDKDESSLEQMISSPWWSSPQLLAWKLACLSSSALLTFRSTNYFLHVICEHSKSECMINAFRETNKMARWFNSFQREGDFINTVTHLLAQVEVKWGLRS